MTHYICRTCHKRPVAKCGSRCNPCRGYAESKVVPGLLVSDPYRKRDEAAIAAHEREVERRRIEIGAICRDCGEVCTGIEDCVSRIAAAIRRGRVVAGGGVSTQACATAQRGLR